MNEERMKDKERFRIELEEAEKELEQKEFFVRWLKSQIKLEELKELTNVK